MRVCATVEMVFGMAVVAAAQQPAQHPPPVVERVEVSRIIVDARVIDDFGAPVLGLSASNFLVTIGGKPASVQLVMWTGDSPPPTSAQLPAPRIVPDAAAEPGQLVVLLFQKSLTNERAWGLVRTVEYSRDLVRSLPASARVAVLQYENSLKSIATSPTIALLSIVFSPRGCCTNRRLRQCREGPPRCWTRSPRRSVAKSPRWSRHSRRSPAP